jgi:Putative mono-oxygenase ydhR
MQRRQFNAFSQGEGAKMAVLLQADFPFQDPRGGVMVEALTGMAESIAREPRPIWKTWTESPERGKAGGTYLFADRAGAEVCMTMPPAGSWPSVYRR